RCLLLILTAISLWSRHLLPPLLRRYLFLISFFNDPAPTEIYTLSLHDALPILPDAVLEDQAAVELRELRALDPRPLAHEGRGPRSEEHTSELQSRRDLVCRLLLEKKKNNRK